MEKDNSQEAVQLPLSPFQKFCVTLGCVLLMVGIMMTIGGNVIFLKPALTEMNKMNAFTLMTTIVAMSQTAMNPIGGKLGDIFGKRNLIMCCAILSLVCFSVCAFSRNYLVFFCGTNDFGVVAGSVSCCTLYHC